MARRRKLLLGLATAGGAVALLALGLAVGRPALVVFWASWCEPCARDAPALERFSLSPFGRGRVIGVDWSDTLSGARSFIRRFSWTFANAHHAEGRVGSDYHLPGLPTSFVLDASGRIRAELRGPQDERSLRRALAARREPATD